MLWRKHHQPVGRGRSLLNPVSVYRDSVAW